MTCHQYGISTLVPQKSFRGETSGTVASKNACRLLLCYGDDMIGAYLVFCSRRQIVHFKRSFLTFLLWKIHIIN